MEVQVSDDIGKGGSLGDELEGRTRTMHNQVERASASEITDTTFRERLQRQVPKPVVLLDGERTQKLTEVDLTRSVRGERMTVTVPVTGAVDLLRFRPTESVVGRRFPCTIEQSFPIKGRTKPDDIVWTLEERTIDSDRFNSWWAEELAAMQRQIGFLNTDIERFASSWPGQVDAAIIDRKARLEDLDRRRKDLGA
jgi:hypothetical protein